MSSGLLGILWSGSDLEIVVGIYVSNDSTLVEISGPFNKILFHHVEELGVLLLVDSGVLDHKTSVLTEGLSDGFAILGGSLPFEEGFHVNDRHFKTGETPSHLSQHFLQHLNIQSIIT